MSERPDAQTVVPLSVEADLTATVDGVEAEIKSTGERLLVQFQSLSDAFQAARSRPEGGEGPLVSLLTATGLTVEIRIRDRIVAVAGADAHPRLVSRLLGIDPIQVRIGGAVGAVGAEAAARIDR